MSMKTTTKYSVTVGSKVTTVDSFAVAMGLAESAMGRDNFIGHSDNETVVWAADKSRRCAVVRRFWV